MNVVIDDNNNNNNNINNNNINYINSIQAAARMINNNNSIIAVAAGSSSSSSSTEAAPAPAPAPAVIAPLLLRQNNNDNIYLEQILFFMAGLGSSIGYISTLSSLVYFELIYGTNFFVYLNCIIYLPLLPISIFQSMFDTKFDIKYKNSNITFIFRCIIGYGLIISGTIGIMRLFTIESNFNSKQHGHWVLFNSLQQGSGGAILYGQLNQLSSFVGSLHTAASSSNNTNVNNTNVNNDNDSNDSNDDETIIISKQFKATVSAGVQASAIIVLCISIGTGFYNTMAASIFCTFLVWITFIEIICFIAYLWLLIAVPRVQISMIRRDSSIIQMQVQVQQYQQSLLLLSSSSSSEEEEEEEEMIAVINDDNEDPMMLLRQPLLLPPPQQQQQQQQQQSGSVTTCDANNNNNNNNNNNVVVVEILSLYEIIYYSRYCILGMGLTLIPSFLVGSWFTRIETSWVMLSQILFYTRIGCDLIGRLFTLLIPPKSISNILWIAFIRLIFVIIFFINSAAPPIPPGIILFLLQIITRDVVSIILVAYIAFCSGYLVTSIYQLAPQQLPMTLPLSQQQRQGQGQGQGQGRASNIRNTDTVNATKQSSILTVAFSISAVCGLLLSFVFNATGLFNPYS